MVALAAGQLVQGMTKRASAETHRCLGGGGPRVSLPVSPLDRPTTGPEIAAPPASRWPLRSDRGERWRLPLSLALVAGAEAGVLAATLFLHWHPAATTPDAPAMTVVFSSPAVPEPIEPPLSAPPDERAPPPAATPTLADLPALATVPAVQAPEPVEPPLSDPPGEPAPAPALDTPVLADAPRLALLPAVQAPVPLRRTAPPHQRPRERQAPAEAPIAVRDTAQAALPPSATVAAPMPAVAAPPQPSTAAAATFDGLLRRAIQTAVRYPAAAQMMGLAGRARVAFDYRDGTVGAVRLEQSAGSPLLDGAALAAVRSARYPPPPQALAGRTLSRQLWVELDPGGG